MRYKFARMNREGTATLLTEFAVDEAVADQVLESYQKSDHAARERGYHWEKLPEDQEVVVAKVVIPGKPPERPERVKPDVEARANFGSQGVSDEEYLAKMEKAGISRERALAIRMKARV